MSDGDGEQFLKVDVEGVEPSSNRVVYNQTYLAASWGLCALHQGRGLSLSVVIRAISGSHSVFPESQSIGTG